MLCRVGIWYEEKLHCCERGKGEGPHFWVEVGYFLVKSNWIILCEGYVGVSMWFPRWSVAWCWCSWIISIETTKNSQSIIASQVFPSAITFQTFPKVFNLAKLVLQNHLNLCWSSSRTIPTAKLVWRKWTKSIRRLVLLIQLASLLTYDITITLLF